MSAYLMNSSQAIKRLQQAFAVILAGFAVELALSKK
jgi:threonine/homoserine/homoserine lactone efflux protein